MSDETKIQYKRNFLSEVIARVDFVQSIDELSQTIISKVEKKVLKNFPIPEPQKTLRATAKIENNQLTSTNDEIVNWIFRGESRDKVLSITSNWMFTSYVKYPGYAILRKDFGDVTKALMSAYPSIRINRLGLRYVNLLEFPSGDPFDWGKYIDPNLIGSYDFFEDKFSLTRLLHLAELGFPDFNLKFQYGLFNPDFPARIKQKKYVLDFDAYYAGLMDNSDVLSSLDLFHEKIQGLFEKSITEEFRTVLNGD